MDIHKEILKEYELLNKEKELELEERKSNVIKKVPEIGKLFYEIKLISVKSIRESLKQDEKEKKKSMKVLNDRLKNINKKIVELLIINGYKKTYLSRNYNCKKCKDTGFIDNERCSCYKQKLITKLYKNYNFNKLEEENFDNFNINYYSKEIVENNKSSFDNMKNIKDKCLDFCENINNKNYKNLMFTGNTGLGKTYISNAIAGSVIKKGYTVIYETASSLMDQVIKYKFSYAKDKNVEEAYNNLFECDLLIIDDLGTESMNNLKFTELFNILNTRILNNKKMIISTNLNLRELYNLYEERVISRLIGNFNIFKFFGDDIRLLKKEDVSGQ